MQKQKKVFIDKSKAVTFKLVFRDSEDPNKTDQNKDLRVFQLVDESHKQTQEYKEQKDKYL